MTKIISFAGLIGTFIVAYACDRWVLSLQSDISQTFDIASYLWFAGVANLIFSITILLLTWHVIFRAERSKLVSSMFVLIGLGITFISAIDMSVASTLPPLYYVDLSMPNSHVLYASAFIAVIGIATLIFPRRIKS